jgi:peptidoglycan/LPS O-acetylase OafA/YrhL
MYGDYAVNLFIVLSGFSLMISVTKNSLSIKGSSVEFFKRRAFRILPPYYFAMLFSILLIWLFIGEKTHTHWDISIPISAKDVFTHILLIHDFWTSTTYHINHAFWSIAVECRIYIFFPLLVFIWKKLGVISTLSFSIFASVIGSLFLYYVNMADPDVALGTGVSPYIVLFTLGMIAAYSSFSQNDNAVFLRKLYNKLSQLVIVVSISAILFTAVIVKHILEIFSDSPFKEINLEGKVYDILLGAVFAIVLFLCAESSKNGNRFLFIKILSSKPLAFIGTFSYSLYLIHCPVIAMVSEYIVMPLNLNNFQSAGTLIVVSAPIVILISYGFFCLFERPFLPKRKIKTSTTIKQDVAVYPVF